MHYSWPACARFHKEREAAWRKSGLFDVSNWVPTPFLTRFTLFSPLYTDVSSAFLALPSKRPLYLSDSMSLICAKMRNQAGRSTQDSDIRSKKCKRNRAACCGQPARRAFHALCVFFTHSSHRNGGSFYWIFCREWAWAGKRWPGSGNNKGCLGRIVGLNGLLRTGSPKPPPLALTGSKKLPPGSPCMNASVSCAICFPTGNTRRKHGRTDRGKLQNAIN